MKRRIFHLDVSPLCRLCGAADETINHLISSCSYIAQTAYKKRHDQVAKFIHWKLAQYYGFEVVDQWWLHKPDSVLSNTACKLMWDFTIVADSPIAHNRPDITLIDKQSNTVKFIDIAIPGDCRIKQKVIEKKEKYTDLCIRVQRMWSSATIVVPVVIGALGSVPRDLEESLFLIGLEGWTIPTLQKTVLLNTCHILRHFLTHSAIA